ncbi:hypothetical protein [Anaeromyxobacter sp. Fw109-5]|nr:hypothetical protein [Anaeromyxobacter sp. Fw109-5]
MRLFGSGAVAAAFTLAGTRTTRSGVVIATCRAAGEPRYGRYSADGT